MEYRQGPEVSIPRRFRIQGCGFERHRTPKNYFRLDLIFVQLIDNVTRHGTIGKIADHEGVFITFHSTQDKPKKDCEPKKDCKLFMTIVKLKKTVSYNI